ncbi:sodium- and chloride-dependent glycine transporter 1-like [Anopheles darlingi]|uniref:sodium- and chloride-dependent glycine transporter 1-like n=1 Tax=Anopheles darlingi TaxID=43151 RepID=UPI002100386A|nr:sodium- and chloride-dependent glycine transporter 1-like [Anopheles darlingi]
MASGALRADVEDCNTKLTVDGWLKRVERRRELAGLDEYDPYTEPTKDEVLTKRGSWTGRYDFLLSLLGYSVGLGNVWRFPYLCYSNGGGAFLIPFAVMLVIAGLPLMFMELSLAQYAGLGPAILFKRIAPLFEGLGYAMILIAGTVMLYYNVIIAWTVYYMAVSFEVPLPWRGCQHEWASEWCFSYEEEDDCQAGKGVYYKTKCFASEQVATLNLTQRMPRKPPAEEFFKNYFLQISPGIEITGTINQRLALCLLVAWIIVFLCLCRGVKSSGKVVYFTALFPYVVLTMLFIRGLTLPGAYDGIMYYLRPDWEKLQTAQIWGDAAVQIFFALSPAWGGLLTLASYNRFDNNCYRDAIVVAISNILTSFFAGFVIFAIIGFLAHELDTSVASVIDQGAGLAFVVFPELVAKLQMPRLWSVLFFFMLLTLGLDSQFTLMETVVTAILDTFPRWRRRKLAVVSAVSLLGYFGGLVFVTNSGMYWFQLVDKYAANWSVLLIAITECTLIGWIYGTDRFIHNIEQMIGKRSPCFHRFWTIIWKYVTPVTLLFILCFNWLQYKPIAYGRYLYPDWAELIGWIIALAPFTLAILVAIIKVRRHPDAFMHQSAKKLLKPSRDWKPAHPRLASEMEYENSEGIEL